MGHWENLSNQAQSELHRYKMFVQQGGGSMPKKAVLENKVRDIIAFISRSLNDREVSQKVERKRELRRPFDPIVRENLRRELDDAKARGKSQDVIDQLEEEYDALLRQRLAHGTSLKNKDETSNKVQTQQERLAAINLANRRANQEAIRKAQIQEKKHIREMEEKISRGEAVAEDNSRRLKTKTKFVFNPNDSGADRKKTNSAAGSGASTPANGTPRLGAQRGPLLPHLAKLQEKAFAEKKGIAQIHTPLNDDDVIGAMDLDIDVEIWMMGCRLDRQTQGLTTIRRRKDMDTATKTNRLAFMRGACIFGMHNATAKLGGLLTMYKTAHGPQT